MHVPSAFSFSSLLPMWCHRCVYYSVNVIDSSSTKHTDVSVQHPSPPSSPSSLGSRKSSMCSINSINSSSSGSSKSHSPSHTLHKRTASQVITDRCFLLSCFLTAAGILFHSCTPLTSLTRVTSLQKLDAVGLREAAVLCTLRTKRMLQLLRFTH